MCKSMREGEGDTSKWRVFSHILHKAIATLHRRETIPKKGTKKLYSGLRGVHMDLKDMRSKNYHFITFVSASFDKEVAQSFKGGRGTLGMIMDLTSGLKKRDIAFADVSWISRFPDEKEVLFAPGAEWRGRISHEKGREHEQCVRIKYL